MSARDYSNFDNSLLVQIRHGRSSFCQLCAKESGLLALAQPYRVKDPWHGTIPAKRVLERRLLALKDIGLIAWDGWRWKVL
jgi:hypothetical protein